MIRHLALAGLLALAPLAACTEGYYPAPYPVGGYGGGYGGGWGPDYSQPPSYGTVSLYAGFAPDPYVVNLDSGGDIDAGQAIGGSCRGYIARAPDVRLNYDAGSYLPLIISVDSATDTTLVINGPDGQWYCDDDGGDYGLNPSVRWNQPGSGQYDIWVGTYASASLAPARLFISEINTQ